jgi:hypothetical protein
MKKWCYVEFFALENDDGAKEMAKVTEKEWKEYRKAG